MMNNSVGRKKKHSMLGIKNREGMTPVTQAERIIEKFGSVDDLVRALESIGKKKDRATVYRWTYPKSVKGGTGGIIPTASLIDVISAARAEGVLLTPEDLDPRLTYKRKKQSEE